MTAERLIIVGAGFAGLCAAWHARRAGTEPLILDAADRPGGAWQRFPRDMVCLSPRHLDRFPDGSYPTGPGRFATALEVAAACERFATAQGFRTEHGTSVRSVSRREDGLFELGLGSSSVPAERVLWATGVYSSPRVPALPGSYEGVQRHLGTLGPDGLGSLPETEGTTLVIGAGNSGAEAALELARRGATVVIAARAPLKPGAVYPAGLRGALRYRLSGVPAALLPPPVRCRPGVPLVGDALPRAIRAGTIRLVGEAVSLEPDAVLVRRLPGGSTAKERVACTRILWATGFRRATRPLGGLLALDESGVPARGTVPGLGLLGLPCDRTRRSGFLRGMSADARAAITRLRP